MGKVVFIVFITAIICLTMGCKKDAQTSGERTHENNQTSKEEATRETVVNGKVTMLVGYEGVGVGGIKLMGPQYSVADPTSNRSFILILPEDTKIEWGQSYEFHGQIGEALNPKMIAQGYIGVYAFRVHNVYKK
jgi:hypothetical protein